MHEMKISLERKRIYLARREDDVREMKAALLSHSYVQISDIGHRIKGSARLFEFIELESLAARLEDAALANDAKNLTALVAEFESRVGALIQQL